MSQSRPARLGPTRREANKEATRAAILESALHLFSQQGYAETALSQVAEAAGVTRGAVYHHFEDKPAVFEALVDALGREMVTAVQAVRRTAPDPWTGSLMAFEEFLRRASTPVFVHIVWREGPRALGWARWRATHERHALQETKAVVEQLVDEGYLSPELGVETSARLFFAVLGECGLLLADTSTRSQEVVRRQCIALVTHWLESLSLKRPPSFTT